MSEPTPLLPTTVSLESGPQQYGPYLLIEKIGAGGMAEVFRAVRNGPQGFVRQFAIKRITPRHAESNDFVEMFCNEARLTAHLSHPNLVQVYDFGEIDGSYYLAMEYLKGRTVLSVMRSLHARRRTFPVSAVAFIARQVALGLSYAHTLRGAEGETLNLVHRDVNPSNIMLLKSGSVKVLDFGIAKSSALTTLQTQAGLVKGKLSYAPPEQLKCRTIDGRSDIFALGVTMWEMATMRKLFGGRTDFETVTNVMTKTVPPPSSMRPEIPASFDEIVLQTLERDPEKRPDARQLASKLGDFLVESRFRDDSMADLMRELFGSNTSRVVVMPVTMASTADTQTESDITTPGAPPPEADMQSEALASPFPATTPQDPKGQADAAWPGRRAMGFTLAVVAVVGLMVVAWTSWESLRQMGTLLTGGSSKPEVSQRASAVAEEIVIELDSRPSGALVERADGATLGHTPLKVRLSRSRVPSIFFIKKAGFTPLRYAVSPERDSIATLELEKLP